MAAIDDFAVPAYALDWLREIGYGPYTSMDSYIKRWWAWFTGSTDFYDETGWDSVNKKPIHYRKYSLKPARRVCREWASLMFDDGTKVMSPDEGANEWLQGWAASERLLTSARRCTERAFALGTGALALWFSFPEDASKPARMRPRRYDARMIIPLSWDDDEVTECAFATRSTVAGKKVTQVSAHTVGDRGTYVIRTAFFDSRGRRVMGEGFLEEFDTLQPFPTFCLLKPAIDNSVADCSPMGQSVYEDAVDAIKAVDSSFDSMIREILVTKPKVFMDDLLLRTTDDKGKRVVVPMAPEETVIRAVTSTGGGDLIKTFQPDIRTDGIRRMLDTALAELGDECGFGQQYFTLERTGGLKTATEVAADSSALMRNLAAHESECGAQLEGLLSAAMACAALHLGAQIPADASASVVWDDSIVEDTPAEKSQMQAEIAAGIAAPWEYRVRFYGEDESTARERADEAASGMGAGDALNGPYPAPEGDEGAI